MSDISDTQLQHRVRARGVLLDIEGTTSSIRFVYDEMFPFVRRELDRFLTNEFDRDDVKHAAEQIAIDGGHSSLDDMVRATGSNKASQVDDDQTNSISALATEVLRQMDADLKATGLKELQGLIWRDGFESGELRAHLYDDVLPALVAWHESKTIIRLYSSGSVEAQQLFFGHSIKGNLLSLFAGHDDTTTGPKKEAASYRLIAEKFELPVGDILFISDSLDELDAAKDAGMQTCWSRRPGNPPADRDTTHFAIDSFAEIALINFV